MLDLGTIKASIEMSTDKAIQSLQQFEDRARSTASSLGQGFTSAGQALMPLTAGITAIGVASVKSASDVSEMQSKFNVVFGELSNDAEQWANTYSDAIGRSKYEIQEAISNQADLYTGMGMTKQEALELSKQATQLSYDLASFNNVQDSQAIEAMTKAMMGETESMKMLGVNLTDTIMENSEFVKSTGKAWKEMTLAEKATARYNEAMKQSKNAIGDAERTSDGFANQMKAMKGSLHEASVAIGNVLLPMLTPLVQGLNEFLQKVVAVAEENPKLVQTVVAVGGALAMLGPTLLLVGKLLTFIGTTALPIIPIMAGLGLAFVALAGSSDVFMNKMVAFGSNLINNVANAFTRLLEMMPQVITIGLNLITGFIQGVFQGIPNFLAGLMSLINFGLSAIRVRIPEWIQMGMDLIFQLVNGIKNRIPTWLTAIGEGIMRVLNLIATNLPQFLAKGIDIVVNIVNGIARNIPKIMTTMGQLLGKAIAKIVEYLPQFLAKGLEIVVKLVAGLIQNLPKLLEAGKNLLNAVKDGIKGAIGGLLSVGRDIVNGLLNGIKSAWGSIKSWVGNAISSLNPFRSIPVQITPEISGDIQGENTPSLLRNGNTFISDIMKRPENFGIGRRRTFDVTNYVPEKAVLDKYGEDKTIKLEATFNVDGREMARTTAVYMKDELEEIEYYENRLGGAL